MDNEILDNQKLLDNQITTTTVFSPQRTLVTVVVIAAIAFLVFLINRQIQYADPYIQSVLSLSGDISQGKTIFQQNCAVCHGIDASGKVGPSLHHVADRKSRLALIHQVISGDTPPMPQFQPTPEVMADLLEYLERL